MPHPGEAHSKALQQAAGLAKGLEEVQARAKEPAGASQALVDRLGLQQAQAEVQVGSLLAASGLAAGLQVDDRRRWCVQRHAGVQLQLLGFASPPG
jgi:hypothetical protein